MLEDIKFDLQTLDYRALNPSQWAELKDRLERRAHWQRNQAISAMVSNARSELARTLRIHLGLWVGRLGSAFARHWQLYMTTHRRRLAVRQLSALNDRQLKDMGLRRCEIYSAVYRHDPSGFR
jgi:uncharacterized protein YjiS (DUF1127 family)